MLQQDLAFVKNVKMEDIPWQRLISSYGRAAAFPQWFHAMAHGDMEAMRNAAERLAEELEHQSTLWHATPFGVIFAMRMLGEAAGDSVRRELSAQDRERLNALLVAILEMCQPIAVACAETLGHVVDMEPLPSITDLLHESELWPEDEEEDEVRWEDDPVSDQAFYSYVYYTAQILLLYKEDIRRLCDSSCTEVRAAAGELLEVVESIEVGG
ncbi:hypothetical protein P4H70_27195 [Paenibacillus ehimensis]|uniref:hypothetical protein n=1 Tax=Paenibacillus ehimensis TaxID=79264 RepID=UPI002DB81762|nr:hypothetical protein [Paenibacillus ehimensis]MEC0212617.1 hypothetical protein [Paenibacillus ehimensis]